MGLNPLKEKGIPLEKQVQSHNWSNLAAKPYNKREVQPYSRTRGILMNGIEVEAAIFGHQFARHTADLDLKRSLGMIRRIEQLQQKMVNWMIPADESILEVTLGYEQLAVDLTAYLARTVNDPYMKKVLDFALIEDFDHLYRYANLLDSIDGVKPEDVVGKYTEIMPGRPTIKEHRHPFDEVRNFIDRTTCEPKTLLYINTIVAAEQQTMNFYMNIGNRIADQTGRALYQEIGQVEEQHVSHYESLMDPRASWFEMLLFHEYTECYLYNSCLEQETDPKAKKVWDEHLHMEIEHLKIAAEMLKKYEKKDAAELLPEALPPSLKLESNIEYVRDVIAKEIDLTARDTDFVPVSKLDKNFRYFQFQRDMNGDWVPSEKVIDEHRSKKGKEYRSEINGPHPIKEWRQAA